jgi:hypothetical protein
LVPVTEIRASMSERAPEPTSREVSTKKTILVVDDDPLIAMSTSIYSKTSGTW